MRTLKNYKRISMNRSTLDKLVSSTGLIMAVVLLATSVTLFYAHNFIHQQVVDQLAEQRITFPPAGKAIDSLPQADKDIISQYAGQPLTTGAQALAFADNYIAVHLDASGKGKTYAELSTASRQDPENKDLIKQVDTAFRGETLRGLLLNAYAFDTMATIARVAAIGALVASGGLFVLSALGFYHAGRVTKNQAKKKR